MVGEGGYRVPYVFRAAFDQSVLDVFRENSNRVARRCITTHTHLTEQRRAIFTRRGRTSSSRPVGGVFSRDANRRVLPSDWSARRTDDDDDGGVHLKT